MDSPSSAWVPATRAKNRAAIAVSFMMLDGISLVIAD
eukprot:CAMPEP_0184542336 /NCGR_PEP_ID=MMETSP0199_2-20130426/1925_1 /TAXON_ID=1112570 /ORGANISM="Thraustochytrium sp., Strain LLF1b" /LENGTH=36 /DNA_ID= /DNA_START= /DNA_END= /DNA_ORIENTATION=